MTIYYMSTYTFEAEPRVVRSKPKFRSDTKEPPSKKTPLEMAEESIRAETERQIFERRKEQLLAFKKSKTKQSPYELRPLPPPKIPVDLAYFLTEQNLQSTAVNAQDAQTDEWEESPPDPPYQPQKKGVDVETQIWDDDLFDYDVEVEPILHVLVSKTLEQAILEVDEANEIDSIKQFKEDCKERLRQEKEDWANKVRAELERVNKKNELLAQEREKHRQQVIAMKKLQSLHIAKAYLRGVLHNSVESVIACNYWQNEQLRKIHSEFVPVVVQRVKKEKDKKMDMKSILHTMIMEGLVEPTKAAEAIKKALEERAIQRMQLRKIQDPRFRRVRVLFSSLARPKGTKLGFYIKKSLEGKLEEWENEIKENYNKYKEKYFNQEENIEDIIQQYNDQLVPTSVDYTLEISSVPLLSFAVASEPYDYLAEQYRRYWPEVHLYSEKGNYIGKCSTQETLQDFEVFLKVLVLRREKTLKENDDAKIVITLASIPEEVASLLLTVKEDVIPKSAKDNWYDNARYRILDEETSQSIEYEKIAPSFERVVKLESANQEEGTEFRLTVSGRIYREKDTMKWIYEAYNISLSGRKEDLDNKIKNLGQVVNREELPKVDIAQWEEEYTQYKSQANKGKKGKKDDKSKSQSKTEEKKVKLKPEGESKEEAPEEEALGQKLVECLDYPIGPIEIDCEKDIETIQAEITEEFKNGNPVLFEKCEHGIEVFVRDKQLRNAKQILHHSHVLKQFVIRPKVPQIVPPTEVENDKNPEEEPEADEEQ